jgi:actin-related protein 5
MKNRHKRRTQLGDRKSLAAQNRMKSITSLASDLPPGRKKRKTTNDDMFGANDNDWAVYREIGGDEDSEEEEDDHVTMREIEEKLLLNDPNFTEDDTADRRGLKKTRLLNAFLRGMRPDEPLSSYDPSNPEQAAQMHLNIERIRVPEALYQPSIAGVDQAGLIEVVGHVLKQYGPSEQARLLSVSCATRLRHS